MNTIEHYQKIKLLVLYEILRLESDMDHPIATQDLIDLLEAKGIKSNRKVLKEDISILNECGFEVMDDIKIGRSNAYYVEDRSFSLPELKVLMDAVHASSFLTESKAKQLTEKIAMQGGINQAILLNENAIVFNQRRHSNESILLSIQEIENAIINSKMITFEYGKLDENKKLIVRDHLYVYSPVALILNQDNYYFLGYSDKYGSITTFRVDRMHHVRMLEHREIEPIVYNLRKDKISRYTQEVFDMYSSDHSTQVVLRFHKNIMGAIYDKFGEGINMNRISEHHFTIQTTIQASNTFFGWISQFGTQIQILSPESLKEEYQIHLESILHAYAKDK